MSVPKIQLGFPAFGYLKERLTLGHQLAQAILETIDLSNGTIFALVPSDTLLPDNMDRAIEPNWPAWNSFDTMIGLILAHLSKSKNHVCLFENELAKATPLELSHYASHVLVHNQELYHLLSHKDQSAETIERVARDAQSCIHLMGVCSQLPDSQELPTTELTEADLHAIVSHIQLLFLRAYDLDAFIVWVPPGYAI